MNRSRLIAIALLALGVFIALAVFAARRVPDGHQGYRIGRNGETTLYGPGIHIVRPFFHRFVVYPVGAVERRFPSDGVYEARTSDGAKAGVAVSVKLEIAPDSGAAVYDAFGEDLWRGLSGVVRENVEIEMAQWVPGALPREEFAAALARRIQPELVRVGIRVADCRIDEWGMAEGAGIALRASSRPLRKVILIGVDGGDWDVIKPMIGEGLLPNFKKIVEQGSTGPLRSVEPLLSPLVWTSIATGKLPEDHGILNFTLVDPKTGKKTPITRASRKVDALWNILGDYGRSVGIVGWLASYPAEDINGVMVTDRVGYLAYADAAADTALAPGSVSPAARVGEIARLVVKSKDVEYDTFKRVLDIDRKTFDENKAIPFDTKNPVNNLIMLYATAETYRSIGVHLLSADRPDFLGVYFELCDAVGHLFMSYAPPRSEWIDPKDYEKYKNVVRNTYMFQDRIIGEFMGMSGDETVIMLASDHGFKSGSGRPRLGGEISGGHAAFWHQPNGVFACYGNGIRRGYTLEGASVLDVVPTILALEGLPQATDMPGRVLIDAFEDTLSARVDRTVVATMQRRRDAGAAPVPGGAADEETMKKLEALGYVTPGNPDAHNNLGQRYQAQGQYEKAIEEFKKALEINPNFPGALNNIGVCYGRVGQYALAEESLKRALSLKKDDIYAMNNLAIMYLETGDLDKAVEYGEMAVRTEPKYANGHLTLGSVYATMKELDRAEQEFLKAVELDPANRSAQANLQKVRAERAQGGSGPGR